MSTSKTIIAKTIIGKGYKTSKQKDKIKAEHIPDSVLGCWIINHAFTGEKRGEYTEVSGSYEVHVWYSYEEDKQTEVISQTVHYVEKVKVRIFNELERRANSESIVETVNDPICINVDIVGEEREIEIEVEKSFLVKEVAELYLTVDTFSEQLADFGEMIDEDLDDIDEINAALFDEEE